MTTHRLRVEFDAYAASPLGVLAEAQRQAALAFPEVEARVEVGTVYESAHTRSSSGARTITLWEARVKASADVSAPPPAVPGA